MTPGPIDAGVFSDAQIEAMDGEELARAIVAVTRLMDVGLIAPSALLSDEQLATMAPEQLERVLSGLLRALDEIERSRTCVTSAS